MFGSVLMLVGAFAVGGVLHGVFVEGTIRALSPAAVGGVVVGVVAIAAGVRLERAFEASEYVPGDDGEDEEDEPTYDEEASPVPEDALDDLEADEDYDG